MPAPTRSVVIAIDAGTTGVRALAVDDGGRPAGWSYRELSQQYPRPGWVEHDPEEIWSAVQTTLVELLSALERPVAAIGITNQRETVVAWDRRTGQPLHPAIVWQDRRTAERCARLEDDGHLGLVRAATGLVLDPYFSASKLAWMLTEGGVSPGPRLALGTVDSWILWKLTGGATFATDPSNASRTMLYDIRYGAWSRELCDLFRIPVFALAEMRRTSGRLGTVTEVPGLEGVPVSALAGDQQAALFGQACLEPGMAKNTYGTGSFVLMNVGDRCPEPAEGLLTTIAWALPDAAPVYAMEGSIFATGAAITWLRDGLGIIDSPADIGPLAESVRDAEGVAFVPAFSGLGSPWWDPGARGTIVGLTRGSGRAQLARAAVEAMAYQTRDVVDAMTSATGHALSELRVDGGASVLDLLLQIQADQLRVPVARPVVRETTALGAAFLAGLAEGVWSSPAEVAALWQRDAEFAPRAPRSVVDSRHATWRRAVERARGWA
ncbi:MAG TPA: glycerol kinase GlpK [Acidimicrobiales bacterium]|nr:glycerol kinase GlpK [Acidimicrobiales bacterium]